MTKNELEFVEPDAAQMEENTIKFLEASLGRSIGDADPIRLLVKSFLALVVNQQSLINFIAKQNLLAFARKEYLDALGQLVGVERLPASAATVTVEVKLSTERSQVTTINKGTRVTADSKIFFALDDELIFLSGETVKTAKATCLTSGTAGNGFAVGELNKIVDPQPFLQSIINVTESAGGADVEDDESLRERIHLAPESFSCAGSEGAYIFHAKSASALISDVAINSPTPGVVDVYVLCEGGTLPTQEVLDAVDKKLNAKTVRPLTDTVNVKPPIKKSYDIAATIYLTQDAQTAQAIEACNAAVETYKTWQASKLGRDINPSKLIGLLMTAGAKRVEVRSPTFTELRAYEAAQVEAVNVEFAYEDD